MPGITGILSKRPSEDIIVKLRLMTATMVHESFYKSGIYVNQELGVYVGWVAHRNSFSDCLPVYNETKDILLIFSGENYCDRDVLSELKSRGHDFDSLNASYLVHMYEEEENAFFERMNGWFSGVLVDLRKKTAVLFNDRYGMGRIYYHQLKEGLCFSSEAKALLKADPELRSINEKSLGEFIRFGCTLENKSLFSKISLLPGGSAWSYFKDGCLTKRQYFEPGQWERKPILPYEKFCRKVRETFIRILPRYFVSGEAIAMSLTGGLDTRLILACRNNGDGPLPCYTFGGMIGDTLDIKVARKITKAIHQEYYVLRLNESFFSKFPSIAERTIYLSDGSHDVCGSHDLFFNRLGREIAPIRMSGKFGSEVIRGSSTLKSVRLWEDLFRPEFKKDVYAGERKLNEANKGNNVSFALFKDAPWHEYGRLVVEQSQVTYRTPYMDNDFVGVIYQAPENGSKNREFMLKLVKENNETLFNIRTDMGYGGNSNFVVSRLAQLFSWGLFKADWYCNEGMPHLLSRIDYGLRWMHPERTLLGQHKYLFYRQWFRDELSNYVKEILLDEQTARRPFLNKKGTEMIVRKHLAGEGNYLNEINRIMSVELIYRVLIESK